MIPEVTKKTIDDYVEKGWKPGHFVTAVLANDLAMAFGAADLNNRAHMFEIVQYVHCDIPSNCHGSYQIVEKWIEEKNK